MEQLLLTIQMQNQRIMELERTVNAFIQAQHTLHSMQISPSRLGVSPPPSPSTPVKPTDPWNKVVGAPHLSNPPRQQASTIPLRDIPNNPPNRMQNTLGEIQQQQLQQQQQQQQKQRQHQQQQQHSQQQRQQNQQHQQQQPQQHQHQPSQNTTNQKKRRPFTEEELDRIAQGLPARPNTLKRVYVKGMGGQRKFGEIRRALACMGMQTRAIRDMRWVDACHLELIIFEEAETRLRECLCNRQGAIVTVTDQYDPYGADLPDNEEIVKRRLHQLERQLQGIPEPMYVTRKLVKQNIVLLKQTLAARAREARPQEQPPPAAPSS